MKHEDKDFVAMSRCLYCGGTKNEIILFKTLQPKANTQGGVVADVEPCDKCKEIGKDNIFFIETKAIPGKPPEPFKGGRILTVTRSASEYFLKMIGAPEGQIEQTMKKGISFLDTPVANELEKFIGDVNALLKKESENLGLLEADPHPTEPKKEGNDHE